MWILKAVGGIIGMYLLIQVFITLIKVMGLIGIGIFALVMLMAYLVPLVKDLLKRRKQ